VWLWGLGLVFFSAEGAECLLRAANCKGRGEGDEYNKSVIVSVCIDQSINNNNKSSRSRSSVLYNNVYLLFTYTYTVHV